MKYDYGNAFATTICTIVYHQSRVCYPSILSLHLFLATVRCKASLFGGKLGSKQSAAHGQESCKDTEQAHIQNRRMQMYNAFLIAIPMMLLSPSPTTNPRPMINIFNMPCNARKLCTCKTTLFTPPNACSVTQGNVYRSSSLYRSSYLVSHITTT